MLRKVKRYIQLNKGQKRLFIHAWLIFAKWDLLIRFTPYSFWRSRIFSVQNTRVKFSDNDSSVARARDIVRIIEKAGMHHWTHMNCLRRCIVSRQVLNKLGYHSQLCFGVKKSSEGIEAHSWLELHGNAINDSEEEIAKYSKLVANVDEAKWVSSLL